MPGITKSMKPSIIRRAMRILVFRKGRQRFFKTAKAVPRRTGRSGAAANWVTMTAVMPEIEEAATK